MAVPVLGWIGERIAATDRLSCGKAAKLGPPLIPVLEPKNLLDVQLVLASTAVLDDLVDQHCQFGNRGIYAVEEA